MASNKVQQASALLLVVAFLLLVRMRGSQAARPEPTSSSDDHIKKNNLQRPEPTSSSDDHIKKNNLQQVSLEGTEETATTLLQGKGGRTTTETTMMMGQDVEQEDPCHEHEGKTAAANHEHCLIRRTLVAHTDYIYTQGKHN
ncbi:hypothetical protein ABZP36_029975 [Zizania latifolia]